MTADLTSAKAVIDLAHEVVDTATGVLAGGSIDASQVMAYDLAHAAAAVETGRAMLHYGDQGDTEAAMACAFVADAVADLAAKLYGREAEWGVGPGALDEARAFVATYRDPAFLATLAFTEGPRHLDDDFELVQDTFRRFAEEKIRPAAEHIHRNNEDIPEEIIGGLAEMGGFGLSVPAEYGGYSEGGESEYIGMVVATEELSRGSLGVGGSLITRPEILTRALLAGGTEDQKQSWLPRLASAEVMAAVAVTEPDFGSDVAGIKVTAVPTDGGWLINGVKTWCTFGARANVLDAARPHRPRPDQDPPRPVDVRGPQADRRGPRLRVRPGGGRRCAPGGGQDGRAAHRHDRLPGHALLRDRLRQLVRGRREPGRPRRRARPRLLLPDGRLRERPPADRGPGRRGHAGRLRGGPPVRPGPGRVRPAHLATTSSPRPSWDAWPW